MTGTCNSAQKANILIASSINGVIHSMFYHNHLRNVLLKNVLESLTEFLIAHLNDSLDKVSPELRVSTGLMSLARAFDEMFSLCGNFYKGLDEVFCQ